MISACIDRDLGEFAKHLLSGEIYQARNCLFEKFSFPDNAIANQCFIYILKQKGWELQKQMIQVAPIDFFIQEDIQNETILHMMARQDISHVQVKHRINEIKNVPKIRRKILTRENKEGKERKDLPTPLEIAIEKENYGFISKCKFLLRFLMIIYSAISA